MQPANTHITLHLRGKVVQKPLAQVVYITFSRDLPMNEVNNQYGATPTDRTISSMKERTEISLH